MNPNPLLAQLSEWLGAVAVGMLAGTSPRFAHRPLAFVYPRRELTFALTLSGVILSFAFIYYQLTGASDASQALPLRLLLALIAVVPFVLALRLRGQPVRSAGWNSIMTRPAVMLGLGLGLLTIFLRGKIYAILNGVTGPEGVALLMLAGLCLIEETIFRGYVLPRLMAGMDARLGLVASAVLFVIWTVPLRLAFPVSGESIWLTLALAGVQGLVLAFLALKSGHILSPAIYRAISEWTALLA